MSILSASVILIVSAIVAGAVLLPRTFKVERSIEISAPKEKIFMYLKDLNNRKEWTSWFEQEPGAQSQFNGTIGAIHSSFSWQGKAMASGRVEIENLKPSELIQTKLDFFTPFTMTSQDSFILSEKSSGSTKVIWRNEGGLAGTQRIFGLFLDRLIGKDYEAGLNKLKHKLESL